jgi:hypothetical protein
LPAPVNGEEAMTQTQVESGYAPVNGLEMYYEIYGTGSPPVLLHGALSAIGTSFGLPRSQLAILPGTTHITVAYRGERLASMINEFLDAPAPASG